MSMTSYPIKYLNMSLQCNKIYMDSVKRNSTFEYAHTEQIQIILRMRKVSFIRDFALHSVVTDDSDSGQCRVLIMQR